MGSRLGAGARTEPGREMNSDTHGVRKKPARLLNVLPTGDRRKELDHELER